MPTTVPIGKLVTPGGSQGPGGSSGIPGSPGSSGINAYTITSADFTIPEIGLTVDVDVEESAWIIVGQMLYFQVSPTEAIVLRVTAKTGNRLTLLNPEVGFSGVEDAPNDGKIYIRRNGSWVELLDAPSDGIAYGRKDVSWVEVAEPPPPPVITSASPPNLATYMTWNSLQVYGTGFKDTDKLNVEGVDHPITFHSDTNIQSASTASCGAARSNVPIIVKAANGVVSNTWNVNVTVQPD